jgi:hypothetical protein
MGLTKSEDIWTCFECSELKGRHDQYFDGRCEKCHADKQEREADKIFRANMLQQIRDQANLQYFGFN